MLLKINEQRFVEFSDVYHQSLHDAVRAKPQNYPWALTFGDVERVAAKMLAAVREGTFNKDGDGFKRACKALGIRHTYSAINEYLQGK